MNQAGPENGAHPRPGQEGWTETEYLNNTYVFVDAVGDTTIRPMRPEIPRNWPRPEPPAQPEKPG
jgi:hypothetical protein